MLKERRLPSKAWKIDGEMLERLEEQLQQPEGFKSYGEVQQWLHEKFNRQVKYKTVYKTVRYRLKAKLKVPRPRSTQQDEQAVSLFKKTFHSPS